MRQQAVCCICTCSSELRRYKQFCSSYDGDIFHLWNNVIMCTGVITLASLIVDVGSDQTVALPAG